jgi:hypothetical protein
MSVSLSILIISMYKTIHIEFYGLPSKPGDFCLAGPAMGPSVLHVTQKEDQRKNNGDDICAQIDIQMTEIETKENNLSCLPGACFYI